jgi:DNA-binding transcriptional ArsR family regulator
VGDQSVRHADPVEQYGFTQIANVVLDDPTLSYGAKLAYILLKRYAWKGPDRFPGQEEMASSLGCTSKTLRRWLKELGEAGLVESKRRGLTMANEYVIQPLNGRYSRSVTGMVTQQELPLGPEQVDQDLEYELQEDLFGSPGGDSESLSFTSTSRASSSQDDADGDVSAVDVPAENARARERDLLWDAVVKAARIEQPVPPSQRSDIGKTVKELNAVGARVEDILAAPEAWARIHGERVTFTHRVLRHHWGELKAEIERHRASTRPAFATIRDEREWLLANGYDEFGQKIE